MKDLIFTNVIEEKPREYLKLLIQKGVKVNANIEELTDDECAYVCKQIVEELQRREDIQ